MEDPAGTLAGADRILDERRGPSLTAQAVTPWVRRQVADPSADTALQLKSTVVFVPW